MDKKLLVILDLDGTLVHSSKIHKAEGIADLAWACTTKETLSKFVKEENKENLLFKRPHVDELIAYCFTNFDGVAIWTHNEKEWADFVISQLSVPDGKQFAFVWSESRTTELQRSSPMYGVLLEQEPWRGLGKVNVKALKRVYKSFTEFDPSKTLIVDDTPGNCCCNYGIAIDVPTYMATCSGDETLQELCAYLSKAVPAGFTHDVRPLEKRN